MTRKTLFTLNNFRLNNQKTGLLSQPLYPHFLVLQYAKSRIFWLNTGVFEIFSSNPRHSPKVIVNIQEFQLFWATYFFRAK